jgi:medium-chain acyl-[acyl-carrier-protein] hydrolase
VKNAAGQWFPIEHDHQAAELKVFCFPYAGGSTLMFREWAYLLPSRIQVVPVELPGRRARLNEPPFTRMRPLIDALTEAMLPALDRPFAFFGHSMGAVIAFELARHLRRQHNIEPQKLFVSGRRAPQIPRSEPITYNLPEDEFIKELHRLSGTPREVLEHAELMELLVPLLRADFQFIETYEYVADSPLGCSITAYGGLQDNDVPRELLLPWKEHTSRFEIRILPGDHFFIHSSQTILLRLLANEMSELVAALAQPTQVLKK